jgi:hypothetical protein
LEWAADQKAAVPLDRYGHADEVAALVIEEYLVAIETVRAAFGDMSRGCSLGP